MDAHEITGKDFALVTRPAQADDLTVTETEDTKDHTEYAGFPVVGLKLVTLGNAYIPSYGAG